MSPASCRAGGVGLKEARSRSPDTPARSAGDHEVLIADAHLVADAQLAAAPVVRLPVDQHLGAREQVLGLAPGGRDPCELEQLAEADHLTADRDLAGHRPPR